MKYLLPFFALTLFLGAACSQPATDTPPEPQLQSSEEVAEMMDTMEPKEDEFMVSDPIDAPRDFDIFSFRWATTVTDVTEGNDVRGINTNGAGRGDVFADVIDGKYVLFGSFDNLPDPLNDDFYEGWIVRRGEDFSVISTGALTKNEEFGVYENYYMSLEDLTDHDFYVLTLEPNDGDPAPADHILDGMLRFR